MKPPPFDYYAPRSVAEAANLLADMGDDAKLLAGGQSLGPLLNLRLAAPSAIIDLNRIPTLSYLETASDGSLKMGAMLRHRAVEFSDMIQSEWPLLCAAEKWVASPTIRNRGTVGGTVSHADPAAEIPACLLALEGSVTLENSAGRRTVQAEHFFTGFLSTAAEPDELVVEISVPKTSAGQAWLEFAPRKGDFAIVGVAACVTATPEGTVAASRIALSGVAETPILVDRDLTQDILGARVVDRADWATYLAEAVAEALRPNGDLIASSGYKKKLIRHLVAGCITLAADRAEESS